MRLCASCKNIINKFMEEEIMKNQIEQKLINFEGGQLLGIKTEDGIFLGIKKACIDIGFTERQAKYQVEKLNEDIVISKGVRNFVLPSNGGNQETLCLNEDLVTLWLAKISLTPKMQKENSKAVQKLINYQLKASKVLHNAFMATEEQKQEFYSELGLQGEIVEMKEKLDVTINRLNTLIDNSTINSRQAQKLLFAAKDRVGTILGGAHSLKYRKESRVYFKNLWNQFCENFGVSTYKDLNPVNFNDGFTFISNWSML